VQEDRKVGFSTAGAKSLEHGFSIAAEGGAGTLAIDGLAYAELQGAIAASQRVDLLWALRSGLQGMGFAWTPRLGARRELWRSGRWVLGAEASLGLPIHTEVDAYYTGGNLSVQRVTFVQALLLDPQLTIAFWPTRSIELAAVAHARLSAGIAAFDLEGGLGGELIASFVIAGRVAFYLGGGVYGSRDLIQGEVVNEGQSYIARQIGLLAGLTYLRLRTGIAVSAL
jgi:hypothetical protein